MKCEVKHNGDMGMGHLGCGYGLNGWGSYDKVSCCFIWKYAQKNAGLQGSTLSNHRMTTAFSPFELPACGLLQRGRDHSPPKACFNSVSAHYRFVLFVRCCVIVGRKKKTGGGLSLFQSSIFRRKFSWSYFDSSNALGLADMVAYVLAKWIECSVS